jgi:hypothetical protein
MTVNIQDDQSIIVPSTAIIGPTESTIDKAVREYICQEKLTPKSSLVNEYKVKSPSLIVIPKINLFQDQEMKSKRYQKYKI